MANYIKPQTPMKQKENYVYPLTTTDQVIDFDTNKRLNAVINELRTGLSTPQGQKVAFSYANGILTITVS